MCICKKYDTSCSRIHVSKLLRICHVPLSVSVLFSMLKNIRNIHEIKKIEDYRQLKITEGVITWNMINDYDNNILIGRTQK